MSTVFICYRRDDSADITDRLFFELLAEFGREQIFYDAESISAGEDWVQAMLRNAQSARMMLVIIGPRWQSEKLHDPQDSVRREIESGLSAGIPILPVLIGEAQMPAEAELPGALAPLCRFNATRLGNGNAFRKDIPQVKSQINRILGRSPSTRPWLMGLLAIVALIGLGVAAFSVRQTADESTVTHRKETARKLPSLDLGLKVTGRLGQGAQPSVPFHDPDMGELVHDAGRADSADAGGAVPPNDAAPEATNAIKAQVQKIVGGQDGKPKQAPRQDLKIALQNMQRRFGQCRSHEQDIKRQLSLLGRRCSRAWADVGRPKRIKMKLEIDAAGLMDPGKTQVMGRRTTFGRCLARHIAKWNLKTGQRCIALATFRLSSQ